MKSSASSYSIFSGVGKYRMRSILYIAIFWTAIDIIVTLIVKESITARNMNALMLRELVVFSMSCMMGYLFVFTLKNELRNNPPFANLVIKTFILLAAAFLMNFLVHFVDNVFISGQGSKQTFLLFLKLMGTRWLLQKILYWLILFAITQLYIELNEKYSPGVFMDILMGKYRQPKIEKRIIMFIDLKDSTPIAEKLVKWR